ncbi:MAG: HIRAN domain-containing protein [Chitinophagales bacterium]|nr:HIRAN domain-containing protein [Chitinophagales bacterium]MDW8419582.1 HIRAN domain-containing protein [Chitinophagales bacterium]
MCNELVPVSSGMLQWLGQGGSAITSPFNRQITVLHTVVAGTSYRDIHRVEDELYPGIELSMVREPDNEQDGFAVKILLHDYHIGYLPRTKNEVIARLMDAGKSFTARVTDFEWEGAWARIEVEVLMND